MKTLSQGPFYLALLCIALCQNTAIAASDKEKDVVSFEIKYDQKSVLALGQKIRIGIAATTVKGKVLETPGFLSPGLFKSIGWSEFKIEVEGGSFDDGAITVSSNFSDIKEHNVKVKATLVDNPEIKNELTIRLDYKGSVVLIFSGASGTKGRDGEDGKRGPNAVTSSDNCGPGGSGGSGQSGSDGEDGPEVDIFLKVRADEILKKDMLMVLVKNKTTGFQQFYYLDPTESKITVAANGGNGGKGGQGGRGGQGGHDMYKNYSSNGGPGGPGGEGGNGGNGGRISIYADPNTEKINTKLEFSKAGGLAGEGGDGGTGGAKGYHDNAKNGPDGNRGQSGHQGKPGPEAKINYQSVQIDVTSSNSSPVESNTTVDNKKRTNTHSSNNNTTYNSNPVKPKNDNSSASPKSTKNGQVITKYEDGSIHKEENFSKRGELNGVYKDYYQNGKLQTEGVYVNGEKDGTWKYYETDGVTLHGMFEYNLSEKTEKRTTYFQGKPATVESRKNDQLHGVQETYYNNGVLNYSITYESGNQTGLKVVYDESGKKKEETTYLNQIQNGPHKAYSDGKLHVEGNYINGLRDGEWKAYYPANGQVNSIIVYTANKKNGKYIEYNADGSFVEESNYVNDTREGYYKGYYKGKLTEEGMYKNKLKEGEWKFYDRETGLPREIIVYSADKKNGVYTLYDREGKAPFQVMTYIQDKKNGPYIQYTKGVKVVEGQYVDDEKDGEWKSYTPDGKLLVEIKHYVKGEEHGKYEWFKNGKKCEVGQYVNGDKDGEWLYYDASGNLTKKIVYDKGVLKL